MKTNHVTAITVDSLIEENMKCSEIHRAFFKEQIGKSFTFNVAIQKRLKANAGKSYAEACDAYQKIKLEKKTSQTKIDSQFEYNTYIRAFFQDNKDKGLSEAIQCWKYKKSIAGHNTYEKTDLVTLDTGIK